MLLRCVLCESQCEAEEFCRREVDSWTSLSHPTGEGDDFLRDDGAIFEGKRHDQNK